jgi:hypothetical protein
MKVVKTVSGSEYLLDEEAKKFFRTRGENEENYKAENDGEWVPYTEIAQLEVGKTMEIFWMREGAQWPTLRMTTPVLSVEEAVTK